MGGLPVAPPPCRLRPPSPPHAGGERAGRTGSRLLRGPPVRGRDGRPCRLHPVLRGQGFPAGARRARDPNPSPPPTGVGGNWPGCAGGGRVLFAVPEEEGGRNGPSPVAGAERPGPLPTPDHRWERSIPGRPGLPVEEWRGGPGSFGGRGGSSAARGLPQPFPGPVRQRPDPAGRPGRSGRLSSLWGCPQRAERTLSDLYPLPGAGSRLRPWRGRFPPGTGAGKPPSGGSPPRTRRRKEGYPPGPAAVPLSRHRPVHGLRRAVEGRVLPRLRDALERLTGPPRRV